MQCGGGDGSGCAQGRSGSGGSLSSRTAASPVGAALGSGAGCLASPDARVRVVPGRASRALLTRLRDATSDAAVFCAYLDRACTLLVEEALAQDHLVSVREIRTPNGPCLGYFCKRAEELCAVSIMRSGDLLLEPLRRLVPGVAVGKLLIQRDEASRDKHAVMMYDKLPKDIASRHVLLCDPMLATGGSAIKAIQCLVGHGVAAKSITFINLVSCPEGIAALAGAFPEVIIVTLAIDEGLTENKYIYPGLGDCGDRALST
jgi:uracil phosphoribosyltransferase